MSGDDKRELELRVTGWGRRGRSGGRGSEGWWVGAVAEASSLWECRPRAARGWWHAGLCQCVVLFTAVAGERGRERERTPAPALDQQATGCHSVPLRSTHTHTRAAETHDSSLLWQFCYSTLLCAVMQAEMSGSLKKQKDLRDAE